MQHDQTTEVQLLFALKNLLATNEGEGGTAYPAQEIARAAIARAEGRSHDDVTPLYYTDLCYGELEGNLPRPPVRPQCRVCGEGIEFPLIEVGETSRGYTIWRQENGAGGHRYWSDSIGGGLVIYDTCLASREELELALKIEADFECDGQKLSLEPMAANHAAAVQNAVYGLNAALLAAEAAEMEVNVSLIFGGGSKKVDARVTSMSDFAKALRRER